MNWLEFIHGMIEVLIWPTIVLILARPLMKGDFAGSVLRALRGRIQSFKAGPAGIEAAFFQYGSSVVDDARPEPQLEKQPPARVEGGGTPRWDKSGNVYWLGHDIMWTVDMLLRGAPRSIIQHGLGVTGAHLSSLGLENDIAGDFVRSASADLQGDTTETMPAPHREMLAQQLLRMAGRLGGLAAANQPDFSQTRRPLTG